LPPADDPAFSKAREAKYAAAPAPSPPRPAVSTDAAQATTLLRRIVELRRAGRKAEADAELTRFQVAFPNVKVPVDALK